MNNFQVTIGNRVIENGIILSLEESQGKPHINFRHKRGKNYTIVMIDPDAPAKHWLHWLIINNNEVVADYQPPNPPPRHGLHRYQFCLLEQPNALSRSSIKSYLGNILEERGNFNYVEFKDRFQLKDIICTYFQTEKI